MNWIRYYLIYLLSIIWRFFPLPTRTGLFEIGSPGRDAPVLVTGNYLLTVEILKKELRNLNLYLLVANSRGINVWCAATGGHFTNHDVISVLKTTYISELVDHRTYILPQLAATGIEPRKIHHKTGWKGIWGPVYANQLQNYLQNENVAKQENREVEFGPLQRVEMAATWAVLISIIYFLVLVWFSLQLAVILVINSWVISIVMFLLFPYYSKFMQSTRSQLNTIASKIGLLLLFSPFMGVGIYYGYITGNLSRNDYIAIVILSHVFIISLLSDLKGSTPVFKSDMHEDRLFEIQIDQGKCRGDQSCLSVCPRNCLEFDQTISKAYIPRKNACVQCGACIVQCPFDALYLENFKGKILSPETIRKYKLNLMGKRSIPK